MVAEKTSIIQGNPFLKSHRGTIPYIVCENEISNQCLFSKVKKTTSANMEILWRSSFFYSIEFLVNKSEFLVNKSEFLVMKSEYPV